MPTNLLDVLATFSIVLLPVVAGWFIYAHIAKRYDLADVAWGLNAVLLAVVALSLADGGAPRLILVAVCVAVWGIRLAIHVGARITRTHEDARYHEWRLSWGSWAAIRSLFQVFLLQGVLLLLVLFPLVVVTAAPGVAEFGWSDLLGVLLWAAGLATETIADLQLVRFKADPANRGRLLTTGIWAWSRHPNYFGEALLWWGIAVIAAGSPLGIWALIGPATITALLLGVSGVPMTERRMHSHPEFEAYRRHTSVFLPMPPRRPRHHS